MRHFNRAVLHCIDHAEGWHQLATGMYRDGELATRHFADFFGKGFSGTINGVKRFGKARSQAPADSCALSVHYWCNACGQYASDTSVFDDGTTIH